MSGKSFKLHDRGLPLHGTRLDRRLSTSLIYETYLVKRNETADMSRDMTFQSVPSAQRTKTMLYVATYVDVQLNSTNQGTALVKRYYAATRTEKEAAGIDVVQEIGWPNRFVIIEL